MRYDFTDIVRKLKLLIGLKSIPDPDQCFEERLIFFILFVKCHIVIRGIFLKEFRLEDAESYKVGQEIKADVFAAGDKIDATAKSKGKGYQGAIKRHGQSRGPMTHGSKYHRHAGSNGSATTPGRVFKGKKMAGHMGAVRVTVQNLEVVRVDADKNLILVKGAVPGPKKSLVMLKESTKA